MPKGRTPKVKSAGVKKRARKTEARSSDDERFLIVGIGASAGGLDACNKLFDALPADSGMVFILVQHLDPSHESMMVDLLSRHTAMPVRQAADGLPLERGHVYVIPPGIDISVEGGVLRLSQPQARHGARLPFDFLLRSLARAFGSRAASVVLSGTGADGSLGSKMIKENGGLVIAQSPDEAGHDGMPRSAMATGAVDLVLPVSEMPAALAKFERRMMLARTNRSQIPVKQAPDWLGEVIKLLHAATAHDFTQYKTGTLQRRIERRMALALIESDDMDRYLEKLRSDPQELELLAKDLLINVTSFFRDPETFDYLARDVVPELVASHDSDRPLRMWIAGCSTGEECYSLAMLFQEQISASGRNVKLQVFASDVDADAVAQAREGEYPESIETAVSPDRLKRFFIKEGCQYRVTSELRAAVVFTVQDLLADPPFSRLDFVSCRNLLIYLRPEAQAKVISVLKFALREGGVLLLGGSESIGAEKTAFETLSKSERVYRRLGHSRPGAFPLSIGASGRAPLRVAQNPPLARRSAIAELCERLIVENYAPAAVLINRKHECLYSLGATDRFMRVAPGAATHDLIASARDFARSSLRSVIQKAWQENARVVVKGRQPSGDAAVGPFRLEATPADFDGEELMLVCFIEEPERARPREAAAPGDAKRITELEQELDETRNELETAIRSLEAAAEAQQAVNQEALSVNEEYQSTNEELETSKEELQSLNEELTALNNQLQESLELQRTASDDLQNVLYSTDVATVFLDPELRIRIFTPAAKEIFHIIPSDIGRPLADLSPLVADRTLLADARQVIRVPEPIEKEIKADTGAWYSRRITPYRTQRGDFAGVVVTFTNVTEKHRFTDSLAAAKEEAQRATAAKSRFLAAASHDLRQPLQTLVFLQGLLERTVESEKAQNLVMRLGETVNAMSGMLNALLDINQIEANATRVDLACFPVNDLLVRLRDEFAYQAQSQGLELRMTPSTLSVESDPGLLEQMIRNLLSNALKYTTHGKVLLGCRRRNGRLRIEVWDTGVGIPEYQLEEIFEEYRQLGNGGRDRSRGLGLGLSIVRRLGGLLGHKVDVRSQTGKGSVFSIEVKIASGESAPLRAPEQRAPVRASAEPARRGGGEVILVIEDDRDVRELLELALTEEGYCVAPAVDGEAALELASSGKIEPDVILADFNLPKGMNGVMTVEKLRKDLRRDVPAVILTGDISIETLRDLDLRNWARLNKPANIKELMQTLRGLARPPAVSQQAPAPQKDRERAPEPPVVFVVDDDRNIREELRDMLEKQGWRVKAYGASEEFLEEFQPGGESCLLIDAVLPGISGTALLERLRNSGLHLPAIMITGYGDVQTAVSAMKNGAIDFIEKPVAADQLIAAVEYALDASRHSDAENMRRGIVEKRLASLTPRQREVLDRVLAGYPSKNIAADLGISQRTVENHRASIMKRIGAKSIPELVRLMVARA